MQPAIEVSGLGKSFGGQSVLSGLDFTVAPGEVFALLGPNGAGKTTTINILTTLVQPDAGRATVAGFDVVRDPESVKQRISLTGQSAAVDDVLTGAENLVMLGRLSGLAHAPRRRRVRRSCSSASTWRMPPTSGSPPTPAACDDASTSRSASSSTPAVLFLDEPTTGLDTRSRRELWDVIRSLADAGTTVLLTTQYLEEADRLADRIAVLDDGRIVATGTPDELKARIGGETVELRDARRAAARGADRRHRVGPAASARRARRVGRRGNRRRCGARASTTCSSPSRHPRPRPPQHPPGDRMTTATLPARAETTGIRPRITGLTAERVFVKRSLRHSLRDGESLSMAIMLPVMLMLLFTFVFGGAIDPSGQYVDYVVPGIILLCAGFGAASTAVYVARRHEDRHHRSLPHDAAAQRRGAHRACRREPAAQPARDRRRDRGRAAGRLPSDGRFRRVGRRRSDDRALHPDDHVSVRRDRSGRGQPRGGERVRIHHPVPPVPLERVRAGRPRCPRGCSGSPRTSRSRRSSRRSARCCSAFRSKPSRGGRSAGASASCWSSSCGARGSSAARPGGAERPPGQRPGSFLSALSTRAWPMPRRGRRVGGVRRRVGKRRHAGQFAVGIHPVIEERDQPVVDFVQGRGRQAVVAVLALFAHRDELRLAQHLEVLRDRRLAHAELMHDVRHARPALAGG